MEWRRMAEEERRILNDLDFLVRALEQYREDSGSYLDELWAIQEQVVAREQVLERDNRYGANARVNNGLAVANAIAVVTGSGTLLLSLAGRPEALPTLLGGLALAGLTYVFWDSIVEITLQTVDAAVSAIETIQDRIDRILGDIHYLTARHPLYEDDAGKGEDAYRALTEVAPRAIQLDREISPAFKTAAKVRRDAAKSGIKIP